MVKDNLTYTFSVSLKSEIDKYFTSISKNKEEEQAYAKAKAKYDKLVASGKQPDWKLVEARIVDLEQVKKNICHQITRLIAHYEASLANRENRDYDAETVATIDYLKAIFYNKNDIK